jgi:hypothetical protein
MCTFATLALDRNTPRPDNCLRGKARTDTPLLQLPTAAGLFRGATARLRHRQCALIIHYPLFIIHYPLFIIHSLKRPQIRV